MRREKCTSSGFPIGENPTFRRRGDREVSQSAKALDSSAQQLKKSLDPDLKRIRPSTRRPARRKAAGIHQGHQAPAAAGAWNGVASQLEIVAADRVPLPSRTP